MSDEILGDAPPVPTEVWQAALAHALDPGSSFDPTLLPDPAEVPVAETDIGDPDSDPEQPPADSATDSYTFDDPGHHSFDPGGTATDDDSFGWD